MKISLSKEDHRLLQRSAEKQGLTIEELLIKIVREKTSE